MFREEHPVFGHTERPTNPILHPQLVEHPGGDCLPEDPVGLRHLRERRLQNAVELDERLLKKGDVVEGLGRDSGLLQAEGDRARREAEVVLDAGESLLFRSGDEPAVAEDGRRRVVKITGETEDVHQDWRRASSIVTGPVAARAVHAGGTSPSRRLPRSHPTGTTTIQ